MAQRQKRTSLRNLREHLVCVLCGGYLIDATTIVECLHSFCKTCIVRYLDSSKFCPICDVQVHKTKPLVNIRMDHTLQDMVYKLVPGLFQEEMKRRREFYKEKVEEDDTGPWPEYYIDDDGEVQRERVIFSDDEKISLSLQLSTDGKPPKSPDKRDPKGSPEVTDCRYLLCPAAVTVSHLKKFIRLKFNLCDRYQIDVYHSDEILQEHYTLIDIAYIYMWRRKGPLRLFYTVYTNPAKRLKRSASVVLTSDVMDNTSIVEMNCSSKALEHKNHCDNQISSTVQNSTTNDSEIKHLSIESNRTEQSTVATKPPSINSTKSDMPATKISETNHTPVKSMPSKPKPVEVSRPVDEPKKVDIIAGSRINVPNPHKSLLLGYKSKDKIEKRHKECSISKPKNQILSLPVKLPDSTVNIARHDSASCSSTKTTVSSNVPPSHTNGNGVTIKYPDSTTMNNNKFGTQSTVKTVNSCREKSTVDKVRQESTGSGDIKKPKISDSVNKMGIHKNGKDNHPTKPVSHPFVLKPPVSPILSGDKTRKPLHIPERPLHPYAPMAHFQSMNGLFHYRAQMHDYGNDTPQDLSMKKKPNDKSEEKKKSPEEKKDKDKNGEVDKYAFTDEDALPVTSRKLQHVKSEPVSLN